MNHDDGQARARYGVAVRILHGLSATGMLALVALAWWMVDLGYYDAWYNRALELHKSGGMVVLATAVCFVAWKTVGRAPPLPDMPRWQRLAAQATHALLYLLMLALPVTGYLVSTSAGAAVSVFGWFGVPALVHGDESLRDAAIVAHWYMGYGLLAPVALHAGAAIKHQFIDRDGLLRRMLW